MKQISQTTYDFAELRSLEAVYVDKTKHLLDLIEDKSSKFFFVSRPRRFGKSLMISTLKYIFEGRKGLFEGLAIAEVGYDWAVHPVLHFDFSVINATSLEAFEKDLATRVANTLSDVEYVYDAALTVGANFEKAICLAHAQTGKGVVVLIDEYDAPISHALAQPELAEQIRTLLSNFYIQLKANVEHVRFLMMTGVTKYTQISVFSALNNLTDLTLRAQQADFLGYTKEELDRYFSEHMEEHAKIMNLPIEGYHQKLQWWYDGYRFSPYSEVKVYNPVAIAKTLYERLPQFESTWSATARPSFLISFLQCEGLMRLDYENIPGLTQQIFDASNLRALQPATILYQAGYLTIKDFEEGFYTLGVPNEEVRRDVNALLVEVATQADRSEYLDKIAYLLLQRDFDSLETSLRALYARLPYAPQEKDERKKEAAYVRILVAICFASGFDVHPEDWQSDGRGDVIVICKSTIYSLEFKVDQAANHAMEQIYEKKYFEPYLSDPRPIYAIGISFKSKTSRLCDFKTEEIDKRSFAHLRQDDLPFETPL